MLDISPYGLANFKKKSSNLKKSNELYNFMFIVEAETRDICAPSCQMVVIGDSLDEQHENCGLFSCYLFFEGKTSTH